MNHYCYSKSSAHYKESDRINGFKESFEKLRKEIKEAGIKLENRLTVIQKEQDEPKGTLQCDKSEKQNHFESDSEVYQNGDGNSSIVEFQEPVRDLFLNLQSMLDKGYFSDISIMCGSDVLQAHKVVLSARSPVFEAMFTSTMKESQTDTVVIDDIDHSTMTILLTFMYSGVVKDLSVSLATNLLYAAVKYQIEGLKKICVQYLMSNVSNQNAFEILQAADLYDEKLKTSVLLFIHKNFSSLKRSEEWKEMQKNHLSLAMEVLSYVVDKLQEKTNN